MGQQRGFHVDVRDAGADNAGGDDTGDDGTDAVGRRVAGEEGRAGVGLEWIEWIEWIDGRVFLDGVFFWCLMG